MNPPAFMSKFVPSQLPQIPVRGLLLPLFANGGTYLSRLRGMSLPSDQLEKIPSFAEGWIDGWICLAESLNKSWEPLALVGQEHRRSYGGKKHL